VLVVAIERLFFEKGDWRVAQHAALLHVDRFEPRTDRADLVRALCFAEYACLGSKNDPRAQLVMGRINWERRLPLAVFYDVQTAREGVAELETAAGARIGQRVLGEAFLLEGLARAYLRDVHGAHESLIQAKQLGALSIEALIQLLIAAEPEFPEVSMWATALLPGGVVLGGRTGVLQQHAHRRRLISLLKARGNDAGD
jgi:hypothetical protein